MAMIKKHYLVLDLGTTNAKAFVFDGNLNLIKKKQKKLNKEIVGSRVEQSPAQLVTTAISVLRQAVKQSGLRPSDFAAFGMTTQRETTVLWNAKTGKAIYPAIVWQDSRTKKYCQSLAQHQATVRTKTGLVISPYFSATKIFWIIKNIPKAAELLQKGLLKFGTPDCWLLWNFTKGKAHATDYTNASRTMLFNIKKLNWDPQLLKIFNVPTSILPKIKPSHYQFGRLDKAILGFELPIMAICGDQQASLFAAGNKTGTTKITYGTGTFVSQVIGQKFKISPIFFTTLAANSPKVSYVVEAKIDFGARQVAPLLKKPRQLRAMITKIAQRAATIARQLPIKPKIIIIDGGITQYKDLVTIQASICRTKVEKQQIYDGTALGVAKLLSN